MEGALFPCCHSARHVVWGEQAHLPGVYWFVACAAVRKWIASMKSPLHFTPLWKWMRRIQTYHTNTRLLSLLSSSSCGGCRRCCRGSRIIWSLRRTAIEKQEPSHTVYMCCSHWDLIKKKEKLPTPPQTNLYSTLGYWHPKPPLSLISSMLYVDQGPGKEVVRRLQLSDSLYPLQNLWHLRQHCWETPTSPCLLFKTALVMFAWMNERLGVNSHIRAFSLATWSQGCFYKFTSKLTLFWVFSGLFF